MAQKHDFVYKVKANGVFSPYSYKDTDYFHFQWLKTIHLSIIMLEKSSVINFAKKKITKTKGKITMKYIRNS